MAGVLGANASRRFVASIFHEIDDYSEAPNDVGDYFEIRRPTPVVVAPGSDMPYVAVKWHPDTPAGANNDGWPAQAANPGAYVSLLNAQQDPQDVDWQPILLSNVPTILAPGFYIPAMPIMAYVGNQFDAFHAWPTLGWKVPVTRLAESPIPVRLNTYTFTTVLMAAGTVRSYRSPWLLAPMDITGLYAKATRLNFSISNATGVAPVATATAIVYTKNNTTPDTAVGTAVYNDGLGTAAPASGTRTEIDLVRYPWFDLLFSTDITGSCPAGVGVAIY